MRRDGIKRVAGTERWTDDQLDDIEGLAIVAAKRCARRSFGLLTWMSKSSQTTIWHR
jgi:hypothetical protein